MGDYVNGMWKDSTGNENPVSFKGKWGEHIFTEEEIRALLNGEEICFGYKGKDTRGHIQYYTYNGKEYIGFRPDFDEAYDKAPVFRGSTFRLDMHKEDIMAEFMRRNYYARLQNGDGTKITYRRIVDQQEQRAGIDVEYARNGRIYLVDEKAQMDYIFNDTPLPTFALEIMGVKGAEGWFVKSGLKTQYYMFIWPHAEGDSLTVDSIRYAMYAFVEKKALKDAVEKRYGAKETLTEYARRIMAGEIGDKKGNRVYYKEKPFDAEGYLVYTKKPAPGQEGKAEEPVNLVVSRRWIESLAEEYGTVRP